MKKSIILSLVLAVALATPTFAAEATTIAEEVATVSEETDAKSSASETVEDEKDGTDYKEETEETDDKEEATDEVEEKEEEVEEKEEEEATEEEVEETAEEVEEVDAVTSASEKEVSEPDALRNLLSTKGTWIAAITSDVTVKGAEGGNLVVEGTFFSKNDKKSGNIYRKLALYAQDENRNVTANYTLKTDTLEIKSPNFRVQNGVIDGNVYIDAPGVEILNTEITGVIIYSTAAYYDPELISTAKYTSDIVVN